ncbi:endonuclease/exonuclease/phosphatase family protein [Thomasclavelia ramosa]|uniref:endonuclease/exonuclease/phosphatase family protein n=1 Tax=Thomasclavelia ramosa TaxID=1547 RepID=UPI000AA4B710
MGILSKYSIIEVMAQRLPNSIIREPRILTRTKLYFNEQIINIYNTHLTYADNQYRIKQMDYVKKHVDFNSYSILAGDFNSFKMNNKFKMEGVKCINENKKYKTFCEFAAPDNIFYADFLN